ncbi:hypothetical protein HWV62_42978 [Athelia sp. TMB]|nr:hypothetical protein HWV62_42978 [Athelia sp. TMB]
MKAVLALAALTLPLLAAAHKEAHTTGEIEVQRALQAAAYHFTAERKRAWAQKVLGGRPSLAGYEDLFDPETYSDLERGSGQKLLSCVEEREADIRNNSCVLAPEVTQGPYYHNEGHLIRQNIAEFQFGLLTLLDIGVIDVETCQPLPNVLVDIWHANATGDYAGHPFPRPDLVDELPATEGPRRGLRTAYPRTLPEETWLRGAWPTNARGVAQFSTIFPGYYTGRALHVHTKVFTEWAPLPDGAFKAGRLAHTGQFFFDDDVTETVNKMWPYSTNPIRDTFGRVRNWDDGLNIFNASRGPEGAYDPVFRLEKLGAIIDQGLFAFITMVRLSFSAARGVWAALMVWGRGSMRARRMTSREVSRAGAATDSTSRFSPAMMMSNLPDVPTSPVQQILHTNIAPSSTQITKIHQIIRRVDGLKAQLNAQLSERASATAASDQRRAELAQFAQAHARLLAPERRLPLEIIARIFLHCAQDAKSLAGAARARAALCAVCRTWRDVAVATQALWTFFALVPRASFHRDIADMSETWLARAGALPISLEVRNRVGVQLAPGLQHLLAVHAANLESVALTVRPAELEVPGESWSLAFCHLPALQKLDVEFLVSKDLGWANDMFADAPQLHSVRLVKVKVYDMRLPWAQLTELRSWGLSLHDQLSMLAACSRLLEFDGWMCPGDTSAHHVVCSPELHTLRLSVDGTTTPILDHLLLPSLRDLRINCLAGWRYDLGTRLVPCVRRSACLLRTLELSFAHDYMSEGSLIECLQLVPTLTGLALHFESSTRCFTDSTLARLTHGGAPPCLLPNLEDIDIDLCRTPCTSAALLGMVRSRCTARVEDSSLPEVAQLRLLRLFASTSQLGDASASELRAMAGACQLQLKVRMFMHTGGGRIR